MMGRRNNALAETNAESNYTPSFSLKLAVESTGTLDWRFSLGSFVHIEASSFKARAKKGASFWSGVIFLETKANSEKKSSGTTFTIYRKVPIIDRISVSLTPAYLESCFDFFSSSSIARSGQKNSKPRDDEESSMLLTGFSRKKENRMLVSTTIFIYHFLSFWYRFHIPSFISSPKRRQSSSVSLECFNISSIFLRIAARFTFSDKNSLIDSDQFISGMESSCFLSSSGTDMVRFGMVIPPYALDAQNVVNVVKLYKDCVFGSQIAGGVVFE